MPYLKCAPKKSLQQRVCYKVLKNENMLEPGKNSKIFVLSSTTTAEVIFFYCEKTQQKQLKIQSQVK